MIKNKNETTDHICEPKPYQASWSISKTNPIKIVALPPTVLISKPDR